MLRKTPQREFPACVVVSKSDHLETHLDHWVRKRGYSQVKIKLSGRDNVADVARTVEVFDALRRVGVARPWMIVDTNEANPDADSVLDFLERLRSINSGAFAALQYLEQPTGRDIRNHRFDWHQVTRLKPVLLDEGLTDFGMFGEAREQGWSGFALKTCKGHSFLLVAAAWAKVNGLICSLQDLTNPGYSALHAGLFAAFVPTMNGVEINSPQFTPDANREWLPRLKEFFEPTDGVHRLPEKTPVGLGSSW
jgi:L-alanine-DL-glutamate epimerase-like enolase superfamily enzyme